MSKINDSTTVNSNQFQELELTGIGIGACLNLI
jgi:hypothetical protein